ncbi:HNH endonuclease [Nocardiopsis dassonvillei]|uniref:HNH endonuclease n=1 Tax=Nocardiopsis dassonvillei TaxID=2014 RepID=UPI0036445267
MTRSKGRSGRAWRRVQAELRAQPGSDTCWLCLKPINMTLHWNHPDAWTADHVDPLATGGAPLDLTLLKPAHRRCNSRRGTKPPAAPLPRSRDW